MIVFFIFLIGLIISLISTIYVHSSYWEEIKCETYTAEEIHDYNIRLIHGKQTRNSYFVNWFENKVILELEPFDLPWEK